MPDFSNYKIYRYYNTQDINLDDKTFNPSITFGSLYEHVRKFSQINILPEKDVVIEVDTSSSGSFFNLKMVAMRPLNSEEIAEKQQEWKKLQEQEQERKKNQSKLLRKNELQTLSRLAKKYKKELK